MNTSYWLCAIAVDLSNFVGSSAAGCPTADSSKAGDKFDTAFGLRFHSIPPHTGWPYHGRFNADGRHYLTVNVDRVEIDRLEEGTFFASIVLTDGFAERIIDARPSDSIAIAVRTGSPMFVAEDVMDEAGLSPEESVDEDEEVERFREFLNSVDPEDFAPSS